jgi:hypothetical protein
MKDVYYDEDRRKQASHRIKDTGYLVTCWYPNKSLVVIVRAKTLFGVAIRFSDSCFSKFACSAMLVFAQLEEAGGHFGSVTGSKAVGAIAALLSCDRARSLF